MKRNSANTFARPTSSTDMASKPFMASGASTTYQSGSGKTSPRTNIPSYRKGQSASAANTCASQSAIDDKLKRYNASGTGKNPGPGRFIKPQETRTSRLRAAKANNHGFGMPKHSSASNQVENIASSMVIQTEPCENLNDSPFNRCADDAMLTINGELD